MTIASRKIAGALLAAIVGLLAYVLATSSGGQGIAHAAGTVEVHVKQASLTDQGCGDQAISGGHFVINQITAPPSSITVQLSDGSSQTVPLSHQTKKVAQYTLTFTPGLSIVDATAFVPDGWRGQFVLSNYLCGGTPTPSSSAPMTGTTS